MEECVECVGNHLSGVTCFLLFIRSDLKPFRLHFRFSPLLGDMLISVLCVCVRVGEAGSERAL